MVAMQVIHISAAAGREALGSALTAMSRKPTAELGCRQETDFRTLRRLASKPHYSNIQRQPPFRMCLISDSVAAPCPGDALPAAWMAGAGRTPRGFRALRRRGDRPGRAI